MKTILSIITVTPFVILTWLFDVVFELVRLTLVYLHVCYIKYYNYALHRSMYLQERRLISAYLDSGHLVNNHTNRHTSWTNN